MTTDRIKEIQKATGHPDSVSVQQALLQVWNECEQEKKPDPTPAEFLDWCFVSEKKGCMRIGRSVRGKYAIADSTGDFIHDESGSIIYLTSAEVYEIFLKERAVK